MRIKNEYIYILLFITILGLGLFVRTWNLGRFGFFTDEIYHVIAARSIIDQRRADISKWKGVYACFALYLLSRRGFQNIRNIRVNCTFAFCVIRHGFIGGVIFHCSEMVWMAACDHWFNDYVVFTAHRRIITLVPDVLGLPIILFFVPYLFFYWI